MAVPSLLARSVVPLVLLKVSRGIWECIIQGVSTDYLPLFPTKNQQAAPYGEDSIMTLNPETLNPKS